MKKALFTIALAAFAFAANAQFVIGGQLGFTSQGGNTHYVHTDPLAAASYDYNTPGYNEWNTNTITLLPKIGYNLNDKMQVGAKLGITWDKTTDFSGYGPIRSQVPDFEGWTSESSLGFVFAPYFRYNFATSGKFTFFCEAQLALTINPNAKRHTYNSAYTLGGINFAEVDEDDLTYSFKSTSIALTVVPGVNYKINDKFSADLYVDLLGLGFTHRTTTTVNDYSVGGVEDTYETTRSYNDFYLMANCDAQTLRNHLDLFRIGFNYHF